MEGINSLPFALMSDTVSLAPAKAVGLATGFFLMSSSNKPSVNLATKELHRHAAEKASCSYLK